MASILQIGDKWRAQVRTRSVKQARTFVTREAATEWAARVEADAKRDYEDKLLTVARTPRNHWSKVDLRTLPRFDHERFCGIYFLFDRGELVYIGQAVQVARRIEEHFAKVAYDSWSWIPVSSDKLTEAETHLIRKYRPRLNVTHNRRRTGKNLAMTGRKPAPTLAS